MPVKIRLARHGRKKLPYYHIVVADSRAPRDGRFVERIGSYNPVTNPASIVLDFAKALKWMQDGAQPTDTVRTILSNEGVLMKKHLLEGVKKGAFDEAEAELRFNAWVNAKEAKIQSAKDKLAAESDSDLKKRLEAEKKVNEARAAELAKKNAALAKEAAAAKAGPAEVVAEVAAVEEVVAEEVVAEVAVVEEVVAEVAAAEEVVAEVVAAEEVVAEEVVAEVVAAEEAPAAEETKAEEA